MKKRLASKTNATVKIQRLDFDVECPYCGAEIYRHFSNNTFKINGVEGDVRKYPCPRCKRNVTVHVGPMGIEGEDYWWEEDPNWDPKKDLN